jgi:hypothetical protein
MCPIKRIKPDAGVVAGCADARLGTEISSFGA